MNVVYKNKIPLVSVIIPSRGRPEKVDNAISTVLAQTYTAIEIIVVDDGSCEPLGPIILDKYGTEIRCLRLDVSQGAAAARNLGWRASAGEFIAFLDDDDLWVTDKISKQVDSFLISEENLCLVSGLSVYDDFDRKYTCKRSPVADLIYEQLLEGNVVGGCSVPLIRRHILEYSGGFDESFESCQDWELWFRLSKLGTMLFLPEVLTIRGVHGDQISSNLQKKINGRMMFVQKFKNELSVYPEIISKQYRRIATLCLSNNDYIGSRINYVKSLKYCHFNMLSVVGYMLTFLPISFVSFIARRTGVTRFGTLTFYH